MTVDHEAADAAAEGKQAAERGEPATSNPHPPDTDTHRQWAEGHASHERPEDVADDLADFA